MRSNGGAKFDPGSRFTERILPPTQIHFKNMNDVASHMDLARNNLNK